MNLKIEGNLDGLFLGVKCLICDEPVLLDEHQEIVVQPQICDKCKAAVLKVRKEIESE